MRHLPTVLTLKEIQSILKLRSGVYQLTVKVLYGSERSPNEDLKFRVKLTLLNVNRTYAARTSNLFKGITPFLRKDRGDQGFRLKCVSPGGIVVWQQTKMFIPSSFTGCTGE